MKVALLLLLLVPLALSDTVDKRGILSFLGLDDFMDLSKIKRVVQQILNTVGSDTTEQMCEFACHDALIVDESHVIHKICTPVCKSFQTIVHMLHLTPGDASSASR